LGCCRWPFIWEVARATSAAPTYFAKYLKKYVDGGISANNPTVYTVREIQKMIETNKEVRLTVRTVLNLKAVT
jgi:patatin-like phospholipase/acyl hydrolase